MNRNHLLIIFLIISFSCDQQRNVLAKNYPDGKIAYKVIYNNKNDSLNYDITEYYHGGQLFKEAKVRNGKYVDRKVTYFENGKIKQIDSLINPCDTNVNMCDGLLIHYYENGNIAERSQIKNNVYCGLTQFYDSMGAIVKEYELIKDSIKNGNYREFYPSGRLGYLAKYENDTLIQNEYYFKENGDTAKYYNHTNGIIDLPYKKWLKGGIVLVGNYSKDKKIAIWIWYDVSGKEIKRKTDNLRKDKMIVPE